MDAPRIVIGLAGDIAEELARDPTYDSKSLIDIATHFSRTKQRLGRLRDLLTEPKYATLWMARLAEDDHRLPHDPAHSALRSQARREADVRAKSKRRVPTLLGLFVLDSRPLGDHGQALLKQLRGLIEPDPVTLKPDLETAYFDEKVGLAGGVVAGNLVQMQWPIELHPQPYLGETGINLPALRQDAANAQWARYDGGGIQFIDLEHGWDVTHEAFDDTVRNLNPGNFEEFEAAHGNAVLGIVRANGPQSRIRGIAPACIPNLFALRDEQGTPDEHVENGIRLAGETLEEGDVLLIPLQISDTLLPVEVKPGVFKAIQYAVAKGIIVIEAAGNQGTTYEEDIQDFPERVTAWVDNKEEVLFHGVPDSGAIIVSGCVVSDDPGQDNRPKPDRGTRVGARIDCCAWSQRVYTSNGIASVYAHFTATSAASPIIAGLALIIQQRAAALGRRLTPEEMRTLLRDEDCGTPVVGAVYPINMPDACKIFQRLEQGEIINAGQPH